MEWTTDVAAGDWIRERVDDDRGEGTWASTLHAVVPRGFGAYARIFHPASRDRPVGMPWPPLPYARHRREWDDFRAAAPEIDVERVSWAQTAEAFGTTMHRGAQWGRLVGMDAFGAYREDGPRDAEGWRYGDPALGDLAPDLVAVVAEHLAAGTAAPDAGYVAIWEGRGGLLGFLGEAPSRALLQLRERDDDPVLDRHNEMLGQSFTDCFNNVFRKKSWQPGILSDEISRGVRLELPHRGHVLFRAGVSELADPRWVENVPWRERDPEEIGLPLAAHSPSLVWPDDHAWILVTEVDYDSTVVGGTADLVAALCADPRLEAMPIREGADLGWDADEVNR